MLELKASLAVKGGLAGDLFRPLGIVGEKGPEERNARVEISDWRRGNTAGATSGA